ncbi:MAG: hypothetical protein LIO93_02055, partial [Bacteroidales bacterium]|nr:hypothetical protein [Bacteroidales bacterium]
SEDKGKKWNYYHTGIIQGQPLYLKWYSEKPLIKDKNTLQVEAALLKFPPYSELMLSDSGEIEVIKDGLSAVFDLNILGKDSDGDGLTDLIEDWLFLDKLNPDTNNNGIPDNRDVNPRVNYPRTEFSKMYEAFIDDNILYDDIDEHSEGYLILSDTVPVITESSKTKTVLIITDNKDLMGALPATKRIICMTPEEYNTIRGPFRYGLDIMYLSTFFKVDRMRNTYKINVSYLSSDITYLVKKTSKGWRMKIISFIIS